MDEAALSRFVSRYAAARDLARRAVRDHGDDARALFGAAMAFRIVGDHGAARSTLARLAALDPGNTHYLYELGASLEHLGQFEAAERSYAAAVAATPENYRAQYALTNLVHQSPLSNRIAELERCFEVPDQDGWRSLHIGHALAKAFEDVGDIEGSFAWLERAKQKRRALHPYSASVEAALADAAVAGEAPRRGLEDEAPIIVCGLPRSGTTLVDRILSSHPDVVSIGETGAFAGLLKIFTASPSKATLDPDVFARAGGVDGVRLGRAFLETVRPLAEAAPRFIDKSPSAYLVAGAIHAALPEARIICVRRRPLDSVLANYRQIFPFDDRYYDYVYALDSAAHKFAQFDRVARHWAEALPPERFMLLQYETLVADQERATRHLLEFCDLSWDARCLGFHENGAGVATPSARQVRQPMHAGAVGRVAKYGALLEPAKSAFARLGVAL